jgi:predicted ATP-dependent endonuclease of OLD family
MAFANSLDLNTIVKLKSLQISNILSFNYVSRIEDAETINFDSNFNIIIGQNGAGKSTAVEVINFIFRRVLFSPYIRDRQIYEENLQINKGNRTSMIRESPEARNYNNFRLDKNYDFQSESQFIRFVLQFDAVDIANLELLQKSNTQIREILQNYSTEITLPEQNFQTEYQIDVQLNSSNRTFSVSTNNDSGFLYLAKYHLFSEAIKLYNDLNRGSILENLEEPFSLVGSFRNYNSFSSGVSLAGFGNADRQMDSHQLSERSRSASQNDGSEPTVFSLVRIKMAKHCSDLIPTDISLQAAEEAANSLPFVISINDIIKIVNLKFEIKCTDHTNSSFTFSFIELGRNLAISDINSLSSGQKAIVHLVFEAFGRGNVNGGLVIIDEPELHLHYQFQNELVRVIRKLMQQQNTQYILVTHSESLINSVTIENVIRFSLTESRYTQVNQPTIMTPDKWLVKILELRRSTHAFFASKVLLVEGETDAFFFRAAIDLIEEQVLKGLTQEIAVLPIGGKDEIDKWAPLFKSFGLQTFSVFDLDYAQKLLTGKSGPSLKSPEAISAFLASNPNVSIQIEAEYSNNIFILKEGDLETYLGLGTNKSLPFVIQFCHQRLKPFLTENENPLVQEIRMILEKVTGVSANHF